MKKTILLIFLVLVSNMAFSSQKDLMQVRGVVHLNSNVSSGKYSPEQLAKMAKEDGADAVFITENLKPRWEYGVFPFRGVIKKVVENDGLIRFGAKRYKRRIDLIDDKIDGMSAFMSAEVAPFYYWTGSPFDDEGLFVHDWDLQFIVFGLAPGDYNKIPTLSNGSFSWYDARSLLKLWPLIILIAGLISLKKKHPRFYLADPLCWALIIIGSFFLLFNYPFKNVKHDQYHGKAGTGPYQEVIDYVDSNGGMTFWSNPEAKTFQDFGPVTLVSPPANEHMLQTENYTGFCCFYEGYRSIGGPGGVWDRVLNEYCSGDRNKPVWTIGEMAYHSREDSGGKRINEVETVFLVPSNSRENILEAMRAGRMYAVRSSRDHRLQLDSFTVEYPEENMVAIAGQEIAAPGPVNIRFKVGWQGRPEGIVTAKLIKNGQVIEEFIIKRPGRFEYKDDSYEPGQKVYYRLDVRGKYPSMLFSNPVFVRFE